MASPKRGFDRAFDIPVGFQGDKVAAEPQDLYLSPVRYVPGQWPQDCDVATVAPATSGSMFTTLARFATTVSLELFKLPQRLVKRFYRPQQIVAVPVITEDGASKRRLIDAGLAPFTPTTNRGAAARQQDNAYTPKLWTVSPPTPSPPEALHQPDFFSPASIYDDDIDSSGDLSMEDVISGTPPHNPSAGSPTGVNWMHRPERHIVTPERHILAPKTRIVTPKPQPALQNRTTATPMRKQLLKKQLRTAMAFKSLAPLTALSPSSPQSPRSRRGSDPNIASPPKAESSNTAQQELAPGPSTSVSKAPVSAVSADGRYAAAFRARQNRVAGAQATPAHHFPHTADTVDVELSHLPDVSDISSSFDSLRTPSPHDSRKKSVRWAAQGHVKSFWCDERVSEMMDSTLESIRSPASKASKEDKEKHEDVTGIQADTFEDPDTNSDDSSDFEEDVDGPSLNGSLLDESLQESEISKELLEDLEATFKELRTQQPPTPPPPKPLIAPLTDEERAKLDDLAAKSDNGKNKSYPIVPEKISARDFGTLLPYQFDGSAKAWLNDEIVNQYLAVIIKTLNDDCGFTYKRGGPAPPFHAFSSHWFTSINGGVKRVERWAGRVGLGGKQFLDAKVVLFPICDGSHWRLLAVKPKERTIEYLDSLGWDGDKYIGKLRAYLQNELKDLYKAEEWNVVEIQRSSRQLNGSDCGVFVLLNALTVVRGEEAKKVVACNGMLEARERIAMTMISGKATELEY
ncbi:hypothetical protein E8E13_004297 [Curvularia kusanoi]|uniref:Ubiquitin-like protease family profile domain-containing protein n=1 Tax=Curvularia kusanoi TaxID=90978 RepID=A0A9P4TGR0_CURKU|nr:hypothetical protein E8E13_004297 [Curvularia kusanoi]